MDKKEKFYVFSGIDHTLLGTEYIYKYYGRFGFQLGYLKTDKNCMDALNALLAGLEEKYDTVLVITSNKRQYQTSCINYLTSNGLQYDKPIFFTKFVAGPRGEKIVRFLEEQGATPLEFHNAPFYVKMLKHLKDNPDFKNYVVIDEPKKEISNYIPASQFKQVNIKKGFTMADANSILVKHQIEPKVSETPAQKQ